MSRPEPPPSPPTHLAGPCPPPNSQAHPLHTRLPAYLSLARNDVGFNLRRLPEISLEGSTWLRRGSNLNLPNRGGRPACDSSLSACGAAGTGERIRARAGRWHAGPGLRDAHGQLRLCLGPRPSLSAARGQASGRPGPPSPTDLDTLPPRGMSLLFILHPPDDVCDVGNGSPLHLFRSGLGQRCLCQLSPGQAVPLGFGFLCLLEEHGGPEGPGGVGQGMARGRMGPADMQSNQVAGRKGVAWRDPAGSSAQSGICRPINNPNTHAQPAA